MEPVFVYVTFVLCLGSRKTVHRPSTYTIEFIFTDEMVMGRELTMKITSSESKIFELKNLTTEKQYHCLLTST